MLAPEVRHARWQADALGLPAYALRTWEAQHQIARQQGVAFRFTCYQWRVWWKLELARLGPEARYGLRCGRYRMRRIDLDGVYEPGNVRIEAVPMVPKISRSEAMKRWHAGRECWLTGRRGDRHPRSRAVVTPLGRFGSCALAAQAHGVSRTCIHLRVKRGAEGWVYACCSS